MTARRKARKRALDLLYEADIRSTDATLLVDERLDDDDYAGLIVIGVVEHRDRIDEILDSHSQSWSVDRMPVVDRTLLRIAVFEILWNDDVPDAVAIDEAVEMAGELSTDESPAFINGLLGRIEETKPRLVV